MTVLRAVLGLGYAMCASPMECLGAGAVVEALAWQSQLLAGTGFWVKESQIFSKGVQRYHPRSLPVHCPWGHPGVHKNKPTGG